MSIAEAIEAIGFEGSQGLTIFANGTANFLCRGGSFNFRNVAQLEIFLEELKKKAEGERLKAKGLEEKVPRGNDPFVGFNQTRDLTTEGTESTKGEANAS